MSEDISLIAAENLSGTFTLQHEIQSATLSGDDEGVELTPYIEFKLTREDTDKYGYLRIMDAEEQDIFEKGELVRIENGELKGKIDKSAIGYK